MTGAVQAAAGAAAAGAQSYVVGLVLIGSDHGYFHGAGGSISPTATYKGITLREVSGTVIRFRIVMDGNRAQSTFNNVKVLTTADTTLALNSSAATYSYNGVSDRTTWEWGNGSWTDAPASRRVTIA